MSIFDIIAIAESRSTLGRLAVVFSKQRVWITTIFPRLTVAECRSNGLCLFQKLQEKDSLQDYKMEPQK